MVRRRRRRTWSGGPHGRGRVLLLGPAPTPSPNSYLYAGSRSCWLSFIPAAGTEAQAGRLELGRAAIAQCGHPLAGAKHYRRGWRKRADGGSRRSGLSSACTECARDSTRRPPPVPWGSTRPLQPPSELTADLSCARPTCRAACSSTPHRPGRTRSLRSGIAESSTPPTPPRITQPPPPPTASTRTTRTTTPRRPRPAHTTCPASPPAAARCRRSTPQAAPSPAGPVGRAWAPAGRARCRRRVRWARRQ